MSDKADIDQHLGLKLVLAGTLNVIGPASVLTGPEEEKYPLEHFSGPEDTNAIKYKREYFAGGNLLKHFVFDKMHSCKYEISDTTAYGIFKDLIKNICLRIKSRTSKLEKTLIDYLSDEDTQYAENYIVEQVDKIKGKYRVILITDLIELTDIEKMQIGETVITKINDAYLKEFPDEFPPKFEARSILGGLNQPQLKEKFLEDHKNHVAIEVCASGYHFDSEKSFVIDYAIQEIKLTFAYLFMCKTFLENVAKDKHTIDVKDIKTSLFLWSVDSVGLQEYYVIKDVDYSSIKRVDTTYEKIRFTHKIITISKEVFSCINDRCCLDKFNKIAVTSHEVANKIKRAYDWYLKSLLEKDCTDEAIALFISLESLLASGGSQNTDTIGENIAIMLSPKLEDRVEYKKYFKQKIYKLRNRVMHHGELLSDDNYPEEMKYLRIYTAWSFLGILSRLDDIEKNGVHGNSIHEYFERIKLKNA